MCLQLADGVMYLHSRARGMLTYDIARTSPMFSCVLVITTEHSSCKIGSEFKFSTMTPWTGMVLRVVVLLIVVPVSFVEELRASMV